jgi:hypothetical protein
VFRALPAHLAELLEFDLTVDLLDVLFRVVIGAFAISTLEADDIVLGHIYERPVLSEQWPNELRATVHCKLYTVN